MALSVKEVFAGWKIWGIPALVELLAPWQDALTGLKLISDYWQPALNAFCSVSGALGAMFAYAFLHDQPRRTQRRWALWALLVFVATFAVCFVLNIRVGVDFFPSLAIQWLVRAAWVLSYIAVFFSSGLLILALLLAGSGDRPVGTGTTEKAAGD